MLHSIVLLLCCHIPEQGTCLCLCRWVGDPVIARAQHSSPAQHSELGPAGTQASHVSKGHDDEPGCTSDFKLLHACKLGNSREAEQLARQVMMMQSNQSDGGQRAARDIMMVMERDSEGVSCLHAIAHTPSPGKTAWTSDNLSNSQKKRKDHAFRRQFDEKPSVIPGCPGQTLRNTAFYGLCSFVCSCVFRAALLYSRTLPVRPSVSLL